LPFRTALQASRHRRHSNHDGGTLATSSRRRSASRRQWSRLAMVWLSEAVSVSMAFSASSFAKANCCASVRSRLSSMRRSFISRRMTGSGSGASHGAVGRVLRKGSISAVEWCDMRPVCRRMVYARLNIGGRGAMNARSGGFGVSRRVRAAKFKFR
jgi:hypothetical protein